MQRNCHYFQTLIGLLVLLLSSLECTTTTASSVSQQDASVFQVRSLRTARQSVTQLENDFVITFSGDGTPISLPPITLLLESISGDLSNNGRVILGQAFADFLRDELNKEWEKKDDIADLTAVSANVISVQTVAALAGDLKEIEATLDTTLTFDGLADSPDTKTVNDAVLKALKKMKKFLDDYLVPSGLDEFTTVEKAEATMPVPGDEPKEDKPKADKKEDEKDPPQPAVAQANSFRSVSFDAKDLQILIPALVGGVAMFLLTAFWLARSRRKQRDISFDRYDDDIDHTVNGSLPGKEEIEVQPANLMDYGYDPNGQVDLNSSYGAGHVAMHIPAMDTSLDNAFPADPFSDHPSRAAAANTRAARGQHHQQQQQQLHNRGSVIDSPSRASSADTSEYSEGKYWS